MHDEAELEAHRHAAKLMDSFLNPRLQRAERAYGQALRSLWLGNAGAALATLSFIGATWDNGVFPEILLWPLAFFVAGIIPMGVGAVWVLIKEKGTIERIQSVNDPVDLRMSDIESPAESVG